VATTIREATNRALKEARLMRENPATNIKLPLMPVDVQKALSEPKLPAQPARLSK
jgi:hypothetical protein